MRLNTARLVIVALTLSTGVLAEILVVTYRVQLASNPIITGNPAPGTRFVMSVSPAWSTAVAALIGVATLVTLLFALIRRHRLLALG